MTRALSFLLLIGLWIVAAKSFGDPSVLPAPGELVPLFLRELGNGKLVYHLSHTLVRVLWAFALAMSIGAIIGYLMGRYPAVDRWLDSWLVVFLNLPALVLIVLCYLWIGLNETAAITAVTLNKIPNVVTIIREGARALSPELSAMARVYRMSWWRTALHVVLPGLAPFIVAAARSGIAVIWKIVLVVEFLGRSSGVGFQIHLWFQQFQVGMVLVYALSFVAVMLLVEALLLQPWERSVRRWRTA